MAKYAWLTDIHFDHIFDENRLIDYVKSTVATEPTGIFITGDISNARQIVYHLSMLERIVQRPVYFVLGNHDYYDGSIEEVRKQMHEMSNMSQYLKYMPLSPYVALSQTTALVGHDCWYDAQNGDPLRSRFMMNDWVMIKDFVFNSGGYKFVSMMNDVRDRASLISQLQKLAREGVLHVHNGIKSAVRYHKNVVVLTHYPPFAESHIYKEKVGDANVQPWFTCKMMGDMLLSAAKAYPNVNFTVLAGHTHGKYDGKPLPNLQVRVGGTDYGSPSIAGLIEVA